MIYEEDVRKLKGVNNKTKWKFEDAYRYLVDGQYTSDWSLITYLEISCDIDYSLIDEANAGNTFITDDWWAKPKELQKKSFNWFDDYMLTKDDYHMTLKEVGKQLGISVERVRQIQCKALRKLKHPARSRKFREECEARERKERINEPMELTKPWGDWLYD